MKCKLWITDSTPKAVKIVVKQDGHFTDIWLPRSQVKTETETVQIGCAIRTDNFVVEVAEWLWNEKGLNAELTATT